MKFQRSNDQSLGEVIGQILENYHLSGKINQRKLLASWEKVVGPLISRHTVKIFIKGRKLFVKFDSSEVRSEIMYSRSELLQALNKETGSVVIDDIILS